MHFRNPIYCILFLFFTHFSFNAFSQKQANVWHFGLGQALDFSSGEPVPVNGSSVYSFEGSSSYCDSLGNLLFYTNGGGREPDFSGQDGGHIWNRNNAVIHDMLGTQGGGFSAAQSSVIVEAPNQPSKYYVFTMDEGEFNVGASPATNTAQPNGRGLSYFTVDMTLNGGLGGVVDIDQRIFTPSFEGLCAIRHANQQDYWILINQDTLGIGVYRLNSSGVSFLNNYTAIGSNSGIIKASPNVAFVRAGSNLISFNNTTGQLSNPISLPSTADAFEFSPNSNFLYEVTSDNNVFTVSRYNLQASNIANSNEIVGTINTNFSGLGQMQLGPDGKIYFIEVSFLDETVKLHRISCPNTTSPSIDLSVFESNNTATYYGLPNFPAWLFENNENVSVSLGPENLVLCESDFPYTLNAQNPGATYLWSTGQTSQTIQITEPGNYSVQVTDACGTGNDNIFISLCAQATNCVEFLPTGANQTWTVPIGVDSISVKMWGAAGGGGPDSLNNAGGGGGYTEFNLPVTPGDILQIAVGTGGQPANGNAGGNGGWPAGGDGGDGNRNEENFGIPTDVGGGGGGGGRTEIRITGSINQLLAIAGGGGGAAYNRAGGAGGGLEAEYTAASNSFNVNGFGGSQTAGGAPGNNDICPPPVSGQPGTSLAGGDGANDFTFLNTGGGGGGDGFFGGGGGSSHDGCFGVGSTGGGGSGYLCATCPGISGNTITGGFFGVPANETDALLTSYPGTAAGVNSANGGGGLVQICWNTNNTGCQTINVSLTVANCGTYTSAAGNNYTQNGTFTETFLAANGCDSVLTINLTVNPIPNVSVTTVSANCNNTGGSATAAVTSGTPNYTYNWLPSNASTATATNLPSGNYTVVVTDANGCIDSSAAIVGILPGPDITVIPENTTILLGDSVQLQAFGGSTYSWSPSIGLSCDTCANPVASPTVTTTYIVTGLDNNGCFNAAEAIVNVNSPCGEVFVPTIFSPDSKGPTANETLCIFGNCIKELRYEVFNRWGQKVFQSSDKSSCWDGTFNGKPSESGAYVYKVYYLLNDGTSKEEAGNLTLIR
jgi:gliding motility-associated-like protein